MGNREVILNFLRNNAKERFSNSEIETRTKIKPHQQVFQITQTLRALGVVQGRKLGKEWEFWAETNNQPEDSLAHMKRSAAVEMPDEKAQTEVKLTFCWSLLDMVRLEHQKLVFPKTEPVPGIYRFTITTSVEKTYIGETDNLRRRMQHYRSPGPSQQTNVRLNRIIQEALKTGGSVWLSIITAKAHLVSATIKRQLGFEKKSERVLLEHAALLEAAINGNSVLNL